MTEHEIEYDPDELSLLLEFIHSVRGFDFSGYKKSSLQRRLGKRIGELGLDTPAEYRDYLEANPQEFAALFDTILINVTSFFRDKAAWAHLSDEVIPSLLNGRSSQTRIWCAGCATGEEAYTVAMVMAEALGERQFREQVKIYATDADDGALAHARRAVYSRHAVRDVPGELLERYFEGGPKEYAFRGDLRRSVIFGRNDLVQDAPISRVDLLLCRNVLMYFTAETQSRILERLNFALADHGVLFLGRSEMLTARSDLFTARNLRWRTFDKVPGGNSRERLAFAGNGSGGGQPERYAELRGVAFSLARTAQILVSRDGFVADVNQRARELFDCTAGDVGRPFQDLAISYRPVDLRSAIEKVYETGETVTLDRVHWPTGGEDDRVFEVEVRLAHGVEGRALGVAISFSEITALVRLAEEQEQSRRELELAYEELQSTNEELETMNEELQSTNDELETMNQSELDRASELDRVNLFLEGILTSLGVGVVVLGPLHDVRVWNRDCTELWGLRADEVEGRRFSELDIGLPVRELEGLIQDASGPSAKPGGLEVRAVNRRGRRFACRVRVSPLIGPEDEQSGVLMLMADARRPDTADPLPV